MQVVLGAFGWRGRLCLVGGGQDTRDAKGRPGKNCGQKMEKSNGQIARMRDSDSRDEITGVQKG